MSIFGEDGWLTYWIRLPLPCKFGWHLPVFVPPHYTDTEPPYAEDDGYRECSRCSGFLGFVDDVAC